jgi:hypothetical protein
MIFTSIALDMKSSSRLDATGRYNCLAVPVFLLVEVSISSKMPALEADASFMPSVLTFILQLVETLGFRHHRGPSEDIWIDLWQFTQNSTSMLDNAS